MSQATSVLLVDDEPRILAFLDENLRSDDFTVHCAASVAAARSKLNAFRPDIAVLDVGLPDASGFDLCREIREQDPFHSRIDPNMPIVMLSARGDEVDRLRGFERGADDYVPKPFSYPELLARIRALLRRVSDGTERDAVKIAGISIDPQAREVLVNGVNVDLSAKEFLLLSALAREPRRVLTKQELLQRVWGYRSVGATRTLDSHASRLRRKLRPFAQGREYIDNVWGVGYRLIALETVE